MKTTARSWRGRTTIGRILALSIVLVVLIPFLPMAYMVWTGYRDEIAALEDEIQATNRQVARLAVNYLESVLDDVRERALKVSAGPDGTPVLPEGPPVVDWEIVDAGCTVLATRVSPSRAGKECGYAGFADTLPFSGLGVSRVDRWIPGSPPTVLLGAGVPGSGARVVGVVKPEILHQRMTALSMERLDRHVYVVDRDGRPVFYSDLVLSAQGRDLTDNPPIRHFLRGLSGPLRFTSVISRKERLGFVERVPDVNWGVIVSADVGPRLLGVRERYRVIGWSGLFAMTAAIFILLWASRRLVRPLILIRDALDARGRLDGSPLSVPPSAQGVFEYDQIIEAYDGLSRRYSAVEKELIHAEKSSILGQLASGIAHEIGTPLNVISGNAQYLLRKLRDDDPAAPVLRMVTKHAERITSMIQSLLDFSRPAEVRLVPVDIGEVVSQTLEMAAGITRNLKVTFGVEPGTPLVAADPKLLEHALLNLVANSGQSMPDGGSLAVGVGRTVFGAERGEEAGEWVCVRIADTGCGIAPENLGRIFQPFFTTKAQGKGTGLGLAIVERIVRQHGGVVDVSSNPGKGSVFTVRIRPLAPGSAAAGGGRAGRTESMGGADDEREGHEP